MPLLVRQTEIQDTHGELFPNNTHFIFTPSWFMANCHIHKPFCFAPLINEQELEPNQFNLSHENI